MTLSRRHLIAAAAALPAIGAARAPTRPKGFVTVKDGRLHLDASPMAPHTRHNELVRRAKYVVAASRAMDLPESAVTEAFDTLRALAGDHDPSDTERVLRDMANGYGYKYFEPRND